MKIKIVAFIVLLLTPVFCLADGDNFVYDGHDRRDPFWPLVLPSGVIKNYDNEFNLSDVNIDGIMYEPEGESIVIINSNILKENDALGPFVVFKIGEDVVILKKGEEKIELKIKKE